MLQDIDVATGQMFRDIGMPEVAEYDPWPLPDLEHSRAAGLLWVIPGRGRRAGRVPDLEVTPGLRAIRQREAEIGLDRWPRVCMRRDVPGS